MLPYERWHAHERRSFIPNMEISNTHYTKDEDSMLWELHEIRHELHKEISQKTVEQINHDALIKFRQWQQKLSLERNRPETASAAGLRGETGN